MPVTIRLYLNIYTKSPGPEQVPDGCQAMPVFRYFEKYSGLRTEDGFMLIDNCTIIQGSNHTIINYIGAHDRYLNFFNK